MKLFDEIPYLEDDYICLKKMTEKDAPVLDAMCSDKEVTKYLPAFIFENKFEDKKEAVTKMYEDSFKNKESLILGVFLKSSPEEMAGVAEFYSYEPNWNKVSVGVRLNRPFWHKKIAEHCVALMRRYLFECTDVKRITAHVMTGNTYSIRTVQKMGFRLRAAGMPEDWGLTRPVLVNKYVCEKLGNIKYAKVGNGEKILAILPGVAFKSTLGSADLIVRSYGKLFTDYTIYLFDDRSNLGPGYTIRERAGDIAAEMHTLGIKDAYVFGVSMGGMTAQYLAIDHPDLVKKMVLTSTAPYLPDDARPFVIKWQELLDKHDIEALIDRTIKDIYSPATIEKFGHLVKDAIGYVSDAELADFKILTMAILNFNCYDELDKIKCPVLVTGAKGDKMLSDKGPMLIADKLGCKSCIYGMEYGHAVFDEARDHRQKIFEFFEEK